MDVAVFAIGLVWIAITPALAADLAGDWLTGDRKGIVRIVNCGGALCGTLVWLREPVDPYTNGPRTDKNNVNASQRSRPLIGIPIILQMAPSPAGPDRWEGQIYNVEDGNSYNGSFTLYGPNAAQLKACVMGGLICKGQMWTRTTVPEEITSLNAGGPLKTVPLKKAGGTFVVPVQINGAITLDFTLDTGAADVTVPADVFSTLVRTGTIKNSDIIGKQSYVLADGSKTVSVTFTIRSLKVGNRLVENVRGSVAPAQGSLLLGQTFLERFKSWSIDNVKHVLLLEPK
jgi:clan AA aspartic protease (TIGR02281 family)